MVWGGGSFVRLLKTSTISRTVEEEKDKFCMIKYLPEYTILMKTQPYLIMISHNICLEGLTGSLQLNS